MTANSTPESFDAVVAEIPELAAAIARAGINGFGNQVTAIADRLAAAHARELAEQQAAHAAEVQRLRTDLHDMIDANIYAVARAVPAMGLLQKAQPFVATCPDLYQPGGDELRETIDAFLAQQALAGGERKDG